MTPHGRSGKTGAQPRPAPPASVAAHNRCGLGEEDPVAGSLSRPPRIMTAENTWVVVLAGGQGTRLQQFIRHTTGSDRPKQFCRIVGTRSMLRHTWDRACRLVPRERVLTVVTAGQEAYLREEACGGVPGGVLVQPANKETAPGLLLPLLWIAERDPKATVVVFPSDHFIWEEERFLRHVRDAVRISRDFADRMVVLGVEPDGPEQTYGWIAPGALCEAGAGVELYHVRRFWEKPDRGTAADLFAGGFFWNTFVLAGRVAAFLRAARRTIPEVLDSLGAAAVLLGTRREADALAAAYRRLRPVDFSRAVLAGRPEGLLVLRVRAVYWSDWGDPQRILRTLQRFDRRPMWFPAYAEALASGAERAGADID